MNKKWKKILIAEALLVAAVYGFAPEGMENILWVLVLPFSLVGSGLRALSLMGGAGNAAAIVLYVLVCLTPLLLLKKGRREKEDWLIVCAVPVMFYVMYLMINPGMIPVNMGADLGKLLCAGAVYSLLLGWGVMKLLRASDEMGQKHIYGALRLFLYICAVECVATGIGGSIGGLRSQIAQIQAANTMPGLNLMPTYIFSFLSWAAIAVEYSLNAVVMLWGVELLKAVEEDPYSGRCVEVSAKTAQWCKRSLAAVTMMNLALNLGQVLLASLLHNIELELRLPVLSLALAFGTLALTRLLGQGKELKEDNDLFI